MIFPIEATGLGRRFGRQWALRDCSLRIPAGRIVALVGPNGAGKTTFLQLATGLLRPTTGRITIFGRSPESELLLLLDRIGFVAQDAPLYRNFTVGDMLTFGRKLNRRWDQKLAEAQMTRLRIPLDKQVGQLSGGQRAQLALAVALAKRPELLLLDEPVASLDPLARREFLQALAESVAEDVITVLMSSHLVTDLERVCDYLVIINGGQLQVAGDIPELVESHRLLIGPRIANGSRPGGAEVVKEEHTERQSTLWVRGAVPHLPPGWRSEPLPLEELVIAYLGAPGLAAVPALELAEVL